MIKIEGNNTSFKRCAKILSNKPKVELIEFSQIDQKPLNRIRRKVQH